MEYKKRDRTGEKYGDWVVIGPAKNNQWVIECKCGRRRIVSVKNLSGLTKCFQCSINDRTKNYKKGPLKENWLAPKHAKLEYGKEYELLYDPCIYPLKGLLINEYENAASFEVTACREADRDVIRKFGGRVALSKRLVR